MQLPSKSIEQESVINSISRGNNVIVDSVAGSGKTTCNLHIAKHFPHFNILLLTYNAKLKLETREKVSKLQINNLETQSYHSFCVKHYDHKCYTDSTIGTILSTDQLLYDIIDYDIIIIDEAQDISTLYYQLICKIYKDNSKYAQLCIVGDKFQSIFQFNGADERFIIFGKELFQFNELPWEECKLSTSFRITKEMSQFINHCMLEDERIISNKISTKKPRYLFGDTRSSLVFEEVRYYLSLGYQPEDFFILSPSIKSKNEKNPVHILENNIKVNLSINVYAAPGEDDRIDDDIVKGKLVFATFHQTKGLERKVIIVFNFDDSYFKYYKKDNNPTICPNELYVAATRGIERLSLIHDQSSDYLPFLCQNELFNYCDMIGSYEKGFQSNKPNNLSKITSPTELLAHLPHHILEECSQLLKLETIRPVSNKIIIPSKTSKDICCEGVSELNGIAIPTYYEMRMKGKMNIYDSLKEINFPHIHKNHSVNLVIRKRLQDIDMKNLQCEDLLFIVNCWNCYTTNYLFKMYQIDTYDWMTHEKLIECVDRLSTSLNIPNTAQFEVKLTVELCICKLHLLQ